MWEPTPYLTVVLILRKPTHYLTMVLILWEPTHYLTMALILKGKPIHYLTMMLILQGEPIHYLTMVLMLREPTEALRPCSLACAVCVMAARSAFSLGVRAEEVIGRILTGAVAWGTLPYLLFLALCLRQERRVILDSNKLKSDPN